MKRIGLFLGIFLMGAILAGCAPKSVPPEKTLLPEVLSPEGQIVGKESWEVEWENTLLKARKEGKVIIYTDWTPPKHRPLSEAIKEKYNIDLIFTGGRAAELIEKILREKKAGINNIDLYTAGASTTIQLKQAGMLEPVEPLLILPEVKDPNKWFKNRLPFLDKDRFIFQFLLFEVGIGAVIFNKNMIKKDRLNSWLDLLHPEFKGKIIMDDPSIPGRGNRLFQVIVVKLGEDYIGQLVRQEPIIVRDKRLLTEWIALGKYAISIGHIGDITDEFVRVGAPVDVARMKGAEHIVSGSGNIVSISNAPHINATKIFVNWLLTKTGQELWQKVTGQHSARVDVDIIDVVSYQRRQEGIDSFYPETEEFLLYEAPKLTARIKDIIGLLLK